MDGEKQIWGMVGLAALLAVVIIFHDVSCAKDSSATTCQWVDSLGGRS